MYREAVARLNDADILSRSLRRESDSDALLRILGFEVLLKCALLLCGQQVKRHHEYTKHWLGLPGYARKEILVVANRRMPGHADLSDTEQLLRWYQYIFEKARYGYELYEGWTLQEQKELGEYWQELGAPVEEADVRYYPNELVCLIDGLRAFIEKRLSNLPLEPTC